MSAPGPMRAALRRLHRTALGHLASPMGEEELRRGAMVFAPHPDDETLGCGGTILRKRRAGAEVRIAFLTDGAASHAHLVPREALRALREREALEAAGALGVEASRVCWLGFPDGELDRHREAAVARVAALLEAHRPEQVFAPYGKGEHPDHIATGAIVHEALARVGRRATVFEYPVWAWRHWPALAWTGPWRERRAVLAGTLRMAFGLRLLAHFRTRVPIGDLLAEKRAALELHATQMRRQGEAPGWSVLGDVSGGEFLSCFFQAHEVYRRVELRGRARG